MSVKRSQSASRTLAVLEAIARHQPVGVSELARLMDADKSAVQRAIMTLANEGWVQVDAEGPVRWRLTSRIQVVAHVGRSRHELRYEARPALTALRDQTGETALLTVPHGRQFLVVEVMESRQLLRTAPHVGMDVPVRESATGRCCLPHMSPARQLELLGGVPGDRQEFAATLQRGYSVSQDGFAGGSINIGAPVLDVDGSPLGALVISAPTERSDPAAIDRWGGLVSQAAAKLSHSAAMLDPAPGQQQDGTT